MGYKKLYMMVSQLTWGMLHLQIISFSSSKIEARETKTEHQASPQNFIHILSHSPTCRRNPTSFFLHQKQKKNRTKHWQDSFCFHWVVTFFYYEHHVAKDAGAIILLVSSSFFSPPPFSFLPSFVS